MSCGRPSWAPAVADFSQYLYAAGRINHTHNSKINTSNTQVDDEAKETIRLPDEPHEAPDEVLLVICGIWAIRVRTLPGGAEG